MAESSQIFVAAEGFEEKSRPQIQKYIDNFQYSDSRSPAIIVGIGPIRQKMPCLCFRSFGAAIALLYNPFKRCPQSLLRAVRMAANVVVFIAGIPPLYTPVDF
jgi:hypothetical protein